MDLRLLEDLNEGARMADPMDFQLHEDWNLPQKRLKNEPIQWT
jgi:hypothetical protein